MTSPEDLRRRRQGLNQALFREVNERLGETAPDGSAALDLVCECADGGCTEPLRIAVVEYERVRRDPRRFIVRPEHVVRDIERVVGDAADHRVVEKVDPRAVAMVVQHDPRAGRA